MRVLVTLADIVDADLDQLRRVAGDLEIVWKPSRGATQIADALEPGIAVVLCDGLPASMRHGPDVQWVQVASSGIDGYRSTEAWSDERIVITNARGVAAPSIAEYVIGAMLHHAHRLADAQSMMSDGRWPDDFDVLEASSLVGKTVGIVGYGAVGRRIAAVATALGMSTIAFRSSGSARDPDLDWAEPALRQIEPGPIDWVEPSALGNLLARSDYVVIAVPMTDRTVDLIGAGELGAMRRSGVIINIARGGIVDEDALRAALDGAQIAAAYLDVTRDEPLPPESPLYATPRLFMTPHIAGYFEGYFHSVIRLFAENLGRYLDDRPLMNVVDRQRGY